MAFTPEQLQELGTQANAAATAPRQTTKERRAVQRSAMGRQIKVVVKRAAGPQAIEAWFNDLSMHGLGLVSTQPLNIGDHIAVELGMPRQTFEYIVKRCGDLPGGLFSIGCVRAAPVAKAS
jgi:hypothetical protein